MAAVSDGTAIEWTHIPGFKGETWNPTTGCDRVSPGCAHCYALVMAKRLKAMGQAAYQRDGDPRTSGPGFGVSMHRGRLDDPMRWRKPRAVFVNSMSDLFHEEIDEGNIRDIFSTMARCPQHIFMVLTKRPERARRLFERGVLASRWVTEWPLPNVWLGVSIENARYTWRADVLREIPAAVRFISAEPLLGSLYEVPGRDPDEVLPSELRASSQAGSNGPSGSPTSRPGRAPLDLSGIDWVIIGGESGPGARPFHLQHAREIIEASWPMGTPLADRLSVFVKQLGANPVGDLNDFPLAGLRDRKGGDMDEWPVDLHIREFPASRGVPRSEGAS